MKPYLSGQSIRIHNRDIALIRLAITLSILQDQVVNTLFPEFMLKMECKKFGEYISMMKQKVESQRIDKLDHSIQGPLLMEVLSRVVMTTKK